MAKIVCLTTLFLASFHVAKSQTQLNNQEVYTEDEKEALKQLKILAKDSFYMDYHTDDKFLINWLRNKKYNIEKTKTALETTFQYRREKGLDNVLDEPEMHQMLKEIPIVFGEAIDKTGSPAMQIVTSKWDVRKTVLAGKGDLLKRYAFFTMESISNVTRSVGVSQWVLLNDLSGYSIRQHACFACIPVLLQYPIVYVNHFLNGKNLILFNAPRMFEELNRLIVHLLDAETRRTYKVFGSDKTEWQTFILNIFPENQLTKQFGGNKLTKS